MPPFHSTRRQVVTICRRSQSTSTYQNAEEYAKKILRNSDYENYIATLFIPPAARTGAWAVRAFNVETALIRENVKNPNLGKMRIDWWRDAIEKTYAGRPPNHPVTMLLAHSMDVAPLSHSWFKRILTAREANLQDPQYATMKDLENYAENTASSMLYLLLETLGIRDHHADHAASHVGKASGITTILRGTPFHVKERRFYLPSEIMAKHSLSTEDVFRNGPGHELEEVAFEVATTANDHLITARSFLKDTPKSALPALLGAIPCDAYLQALEKANFNLFEVKLARWKLLYKLWSAARKGVI
ncbi:hypothetical protein SpCBS45565_g05818 [Spizellomyces sp. 'palustris']|nr:hypothetical protein SpCBS45565_g05818 [Spizellomyces sp. 'palustris']